MKYFSDLKAEIRRQWRRLYRKEMESSGQPLSDGFHEEEPSDGDLYPPDPKRVAARACCLAAVALRGLANQWPFEEQKEFLPRLYQWFLQSGLEREIEDSERKILETGAGELDAQDALNALWRWEGAAVLLASLGRLSLPRDDETIDPKLCGDACGLLASRSELEQLIDNASFDRHFDRLAYSNRVLAIHWRLRALLHTRVEQIDFVRFAEGVQWAEFNLEWSSMKAISLFAASQLLQQKMMIWAHS